MGLDKDDIKQLIAILQKGLDNSDDHDNDTEEIVEKRGVKKKTRATKKNKNLFEQMPEKAMHKDDIAIDRQLQKLPPTQRARNFKQLAIRCRVCGKEEKVNPVLVESIERYKCNKCSTSAG